MESLWNIEYPELTDLGEEFQDILFDMFESRVPFWRTYAAIVSEYIWIYLPEIKNDLNLCPYAEVLYLILFKLLSKSQWLYVFQIINNTLLFEENNDCDMILKSIDSITNEFSARGLTGIRNTITNVGCNLDGIPVVKCGKYINS